MVKKIFSIVLVLSVMGLVLGGCSKPAEEGEATPAETPAAE